MIAPAQQITSSFAMKTHTTRLTPSQRLRTTVSPAFNHTSRTLKRGSAYHHAKIRAQQEESISISTDNADATTNGAAPTPPAATDSTPSTPQQQQPQPNPPQPEFWTSFKLFFALPWRRFKNQSALSITLKNSISEIPVGRFSPTISLPALVDALEKATYDPRITGLIVKIDPLSIGWGKAAEIRRAILQFKEKTGGKKFTIAYMERAGEKEYYLASAFDEIYVPPSGNLGLRGFAATGTFLRGVLDKIGVQPELKRIGKYKSAGDQILRKDMSEAQREALDAILDDISTHWMEAVAEARGKTVEEVQAMMDKGIYDMEEFKAGGWVTDLKYQDEIEDLLKERTGGKEDQYRFVKFGRYKKVSRSAFGIDGKKTIAVVRTAGAITGGDGGRTSSGITATAVISQLRRLVENKKIAAVILRIDSPGGDALASDLMWREIRKLAGKKPVIASMSDVAASGGYYMAMGASKIVSEALTLTGSIGVITGKFSLSELYEKVGYSKTILSRGKYAQLLADNKPFTPEEAGLFDQAAQYAYESFRNKAAESRGMQPDVMQQFAQGRVWTGEAAMKIGLVDAVGGMQQAVVLAKEAAEIAEGEGVRLREVSMAPTSPLALITGGGGASVMINMVVMMAGMVMGGGRNNSNNSVSTMLGAPVLLDAILKTVASSGSGSNGSVMAVMPELAVDGVSTQALLTTMGSADAIAMQQQQASLGVWFSDNEYDLFD